jgi:AraC family transcriptional regulator of adaptative response/methylated-DNA-[protein]-cysteine methyltransferase
MLSTIADYSEVLQSVRPATKPVTEMDATKRTKQPATLTGEVIRYGFGQTSLGAILVALSDNGVVAIAITEHAGRDAQIEALQERFPRARLERDALATRDAVKRIVGFVETPHADLGLALDIRGTAFQRRIWKAVANIPFATTSSFAAIAKEVGSPRAVRAVGNACSRNPLEFAIPCHRVLRTDHSYAGGSAWGDRRQATLVARECKSRRSSG